MANLQYIGARYVPKFYENPDTGDITWKSGVAYEPLTVVKYNDDTYTSKIPVPSSVGNPADYSNYWAKTADFNAALSALQTQVNSLGLKVDNLQIFNVKDFGAIGDGIINDTNAIQEAINTAKLVKGTVYVPDGTYIIDELTIDDYVNFVCVGVLQCSPYTVNAITIDVPTLFISRSDMTNFMNWYTMQFRLFGNTSTSVGLNLLNAGNINIVDSVIANFEDYCIKLTKSSNPGTIARVELIGNENNNCVGIYHRNDIKICEADIINCAVGLQPDGSASYSNIHIWTFHEDSIGIDHLDGKLLIDNLYFDTIKTCIKKGNYANIKCTNMWVHNSNNIIDNADITVFETNNFAHYGNCTFVNLIIDCAGCKFTNRTDNIYIGLLGKTQASGVVYPTYFNKLMDITFEPSGTSESWLEHNPATDKYIAHIKESGSVTNQKTFDTNLSGIINEQFGSIFTDGGLYSPTKVGKIYLSNAGVLLVASLDGTNPSNITGTFEFTIS